jgi:hypothetical protein
MTAAAQSQGVLTGQSQIPSVQSIESRSASMELVGWTDPGVVAGSRAGLQPKDMVIGVTCGKHSRAYFVPAWDAGAPGGDFIIRDMVGDQQITIALSGRDDQIVVWRHVEGGKRVRHPYRIAPWYTWLREHPRTDVAGSGSLADAERQG